MRPLTQAMASHARAMVRSSAGREGLEGVVRLTAPTVMGIHVLPPMLRDLRAVAPGVQVELVTSDVVDDLVRRDADIAVRTVPSTQASLVARRVGHVGVGLAASPAYLEGRHTPRSMADLYEHDWVVDDRLSIVQRGLAHLGIEVERLSRVLRTDDSVAQLAAIAAGIGVGPCQAPLIERLGLVRLLPELSVPMPVWLVVHEDLRHVARIRCVFGHLAERYAAYVTRSADAGLS